MRTKITPSIKNYLPILCGAITSLIVLVLLNRDFPTVGHDYRYFIVRMLDTKLFMIQNGLAIQWYTPSFGGGLPAYPNPQHIQYSILQIIYLWTNSWVAILLSTFIITLTGFMFFEQFLEKTLSFHWTSSTLGAIFFIANGFFIEHMIVGHIGHQLFPLGGILLNAAVDNHKPVIKSGAIIGLILAMMIHQTGFYIIVILGISVIMMLPLVYLYRPTLLSPKHTLSKLAVGCVLAALVGGSKIHAVTALMQYFPRVVNDSYQIGIAQGLLGILVQLFGAMFMAPFLLLAGLNLSVISSILSTVTGAYYGIWETDIGLSPVLIVLLLYSLFRRIRKIGKKHSINKLTLAQWLAWSVLLLGVWITIELTLARGFLFPYLKALPLFRSMHVNVRFAAALILPLILIGVAEYEALNGPKLRPSLFVLVAVLSLAFMFTYNLIPANVYNRDFDLEKILQTDEAVQSGDSFPIDHVAAIKDEDTFASHATSILYYEPLFSDYDRIRGYILSTDVAIQVHPGPVTDIEDGYYNMTNPASLIFPNENNVRPFERIKINESEQLQAFVHREQPAWKISNMQRILDRVSAAAFILTIILGIIPLQFQKAEQLMSRRSTKA